jgi:hypothetical protein
VRSFLTATEDPMAPTQACLLCKTLLSSTGRGANKVVFLGMEVDLKGFKPALWLLLVLGLLLLLIVLLLACRLYYLAKQSVAVKKVPKTTQATRRQWFLVGLCFIMMPCVISLIIWSLIQHKKSSRLRDEWWSWD